MSSPFDLSPTGIAATDLAPVELARILDELSDAVVALARGAPAELTSDQLSTAVGSIARLFASCALRAGRTELISSEDLSTTEAVTLIEGLMAAQNLNAFDLALWLSRGRVSRSDGKEAAK